MKPFLFLLLILPAGLIAQQTNVSAQKTQVPVGATDISASIANISSLSSNIKDLAATIKSAAEQINAFKSSRATVQSKMTSLRKQIDDTRGNESKKDEVARLEKELAELTNQLNEINKQISVFENLIDKQTAEINRLEALIDQERKKMEEIAARDRQKTDKSKQTEDPKKPTTTDEEKALAYAHVRIIMDSLPTIVSKLSVAERNLVSGFTSRFNNDTQFRSATTAYIKHSKASNYIEVMSRGGSSADLQNRLLNAAREELVILARN